MYYNSEREILKAEAKARIIEELENDYDGYLCDLHNRVFNEDYEYIYTSEAREMLNRYDVFDAIEEIKEYEQNNFGEVNTDFSSSCAVANMIWYIIGEEALQELMEDSAECDELWNEEIGDIERKVLIKIFKEKAEEN